MPIHGCAHAFEELASTVLPRHMSRMFAAMTEPKRMADFAQPGIGTKSLLKQFDLERDFPGCYVLLDSRLPIYVGISRGVIGRLRQHVRGRTHYDASLAYRMAVARYSGPCLKRWTREEAMQDEMFRMSFKDAQSDLQSLEVASIQIENPLERYVFEPYCAMKLDTHQWNSFETH